jgi:hypothetical protein
MPIRKTAKGETRKNRPRTLVSSNDSVRRVMKNAAADVALSGQPSFFSPLLSTDFLQLPQTPAEKRVMIHHFYRTDPIVGQSIDLHGELPLSKVRLAKPKVMNETEAKKLGFESANDRAEYILDFYLTMCKKMKMFQRLLEISHHWNLDGDVFIFAEDSDVELDADQEAKLRVVKEDGTVEDRTEAVKQQLYKGWERLQVLSPDMIKTESYQFSDEENIELIIDSKTRKMVEEAEYDPESNYKISHIPDSLMEFIHDGGNVPLGTDPYEGSFVYHLSRKKAAYEENGISLVDRCLRTLLYREKLRQAQTQIADRAMTPKRLIWAEDLSGDDVEELRSQVDTALLDPDFSIITNYEVHWEDIGARDRLLDLTGEYEVNDKHLYIGLGVTESLLVGETSYGGDRLRIEVINTRYLLFREIIMTYVEEYLFEPIAKKKGFFEHDKWGNIKYIYPKLQFTRLALRDTQDTYDQLFNLYQKGSIDVGTILDILNLDPEDIKQRVQKDLFTVNDPVYNDLIRNLYDRIADKVADESDLFDRLIEGLKLKKVSPEGDGGGMDDEGGLGVDTELGL